MEPDADRQPVSTESGLEISADDSAVAAEPSDQGRRPGQSKPWLDNSAPQPIPEPVLDCLEALMAALVSLFERPRGLGEIQLGLHHFDTQSGPRT